MLRTVSLMLILLTCAGAAQADKKLITEGGREVLLKADGSWEFLSEDRFAVTPEGRRVRLKPDGSWEYTGGKQVERQAADAGVGDRTYLSALAVDVVLEDLVIETAREKRSAVHKNKSKSSQSVFYLRVSLDSGASEPMEVTFETGDFAIADSREREYAVIGVSPDSLTLQPGKEARIAVRADDAPGWFASPDWMSIRIDKTVFDSAEDIVLKREMKHVREIEVEEL